MSGFIDAFKAIIVPALIAAFIYLLLAYVVLPLVRRHRNRYDQYLPVQSISQHTSHFRDRLSNAFFSFILRPFVNDNSVVDGSGMRRESGDDLAFGEDEGESMVGFDVSRRDRTVRGGNVEVTSDRRLSRDLEEGFKDDSEDDSGDDRRR